MFDPELMADNIRERASDSFQPMTAILALSSYFFDWMFAIVSRAKAE
jgi:hypothetical protein